MRYCPQCFNEYQDGFDLCHSCEVSLVEGQQEQIHNIWTHEGLQDAIRGKKLVPIANAPLERCREFQRALLESGIPAIISSEGDDTCLQGCVPRLYVSVPEDRSMDAVKLAQEGWKELVSEEGLSPITDGVVDLEAAEITCPACGFTGALTPAGVCGDCGLVLGME